MGSGLAFGGFATYGFRPPPHRRLRRLPKCTLLSLSPPPSSAFGSATSPRLRLVEGGIGDSAGGRGAKPPSPLPVSRGVVGPPSYYVGGGPSSPPPSFQGVGGLRPPLRLRRIHPRRSRRLRHVLSLRSFLRYAQSVATLLFFLLLRTYVSREASLRFLRTYVPSEATRPSAASLRFIRTYVRSEAKLRGKFRGN